MRKLVVLFVVVVFAVFLVGCSGPMNTKITGKNYDDLGQKVLESLPQQDQIVLVAYINDLQMHDENFPASIVGKTYKQILKEGKNKLEKMFN